MGINLRSVPCRNCNAMREANLSLPCPKCRSRQTIFGYLYEHEFRRYALWGVIGILAVSVVICAGLITQIKGGIDGLATQVQIAGETQTQLAAIETVTQAAVEQAITIAVGTHQAATAVAATLTQAAVPPTPTPTVTPTLPPPPSACAATVIRGAAPLYDLPTQGRVALLTLDVKTPINVVGQLKKETSWYWVQLGEQRKWLPSDYLKLDKTDCQPTEYDLTYALNLPAIGEQVVFEEPFTSRKWSTNTGASLFPEPTQGEYQIKARAATTITLENETLLTTMLGNFNMYLAVERKENLDNTSTIGVRFLVDNGHYLTLRVNRDCRLELRNEKEELLQRATPPSGANTCDDEQEDYLEMHTTPNQLTVRINDSIPVEWDLTMQPNANGTLQLEMRAVDFVLNFLVITAPTTP